MVQYSIDEERKVLERVILDIIKEYKCKNVREVVEIAQKIDRNLDTNEIRRILLSLQSKNIIKLKEPLFVGSFKDFILDKYASIKFWLVIAFVSLTLSVVYFIPPIEHYLHIRWFIGSIFIFFIPGYSFTNMLFRGVTFPLKIVLSIALSIILTALIGVSLNYTMIGVKLTPLLVILSTISVSMASIGIYKEYLEKKR